MLLPLLLSLNGRGCICFDLSPCSGFCNWFLLIRRVKRALLLPFSRHLAKVRLGQVYQRSLFLRLTWVCDDVRNNRLFFLNWWKFLLLLFKLPQLLSLLLLFLRTFLFVCFHFSWESSPPWTGLLLPAEHLLLCTQATYNLFLSCLFLILL